jgi:hypothetical protein
VVDREGIPLAIRQSGANVHDSKLLEETWMRFQHSKAAAVIRANGQPR